MVFEDHNIIVSYSGTLPRVPFLAMKEKILGKGYELSVAFVTEKKAQSINIERRKKDYVPNTLSFPLSKQSGEIILCKSILQKQYKDFDMSYTDYIIFILIHSMLHLKGMDHGPAMEKIEQKLLGQFKTKVENTQK